ncbi:neurogenic locus notch homolog protein 1 [Patella vulgata]|uniref:neurogenic locus notch homolog protein 1 n=1 Tax=Patella vulgata TaxID=6465 RepID=UPI00218036D6|nr:neurogenic locus notch homolog protein 1 [Patella vulgata]
MASNNILVYILVYFTVIAEVYALDECKDTKNVPVCKENEKYCFNAPSTWRIFMEKVCMSTCRYCITENVAIGRNTTQSSYSDQIVYNSFNAVDGESHDKYGSCSLTNTRNRMKSWWCVDLQKQYKFKEIRVYGGTNAIVSLSNFTVIISDNGSCDEATLRSSQVCYKDPGSNRNPYSIDRCDERNVDFNGRIVFITTGMEYRPLGLCEVEVYSARCSDGYYETSRGSCTRCNCDARPCDPDTGRCLKKCAINCKNDKCDVDGRCTDGCNVGFYGSDCMGECSPNCKDNICYGIGVCSACRDGFYGNVCSKNCFNCNPGGCKRISGVCINGCKDGFYGAGRRCKKECPNCNPGGCQMKDGACINGCKDGFYGRKCELKCSTCKPGGCDKQGVCTNGCLDGFYGSDGLCLRKCSNCLPGGCDKDGGVCISGCIEGWYTDTCNTSCSSYCQGGCYRSNGICTTCYSGRYGDYCQYECSSYCQGGCDRSNGICTTCSPGRYGDYCQHECSDGCISSVCSLDGVCLCKASYYGNKCESSCSDKCFNRTCQLQPTSGDPVCSDGCIDGYTDSYCQTLCPYNCVTCNTTDCSVCKPGWYGKKCQTSCQTGYYGHFCNTSCRTTCFEGCRPSDGYCNACIVGYFGRTCNQTCSKTCEGGCNRDGKCLRCSKSFYGDYCDKNCSNNCIDSDCEGPTNYLKCSKGCVEGKTRQYCDEDCPDTCIYCDQSRRNICSACKDGWRGSDCSQSCALLSENCIECHQDLPRCLSCNSGWFGKRCNERCPTGCLDNSCNLNGTCQSCASGYFGYICSSTCPIGCLDNICNMDGTCEACKHGHYGITCGKKCSTNCKSSTGLTVCNITDGSCMDDCGDGTSGHNCTGGENFACPSGWTRHNVQCIKAVAQMLNWEEASLYCKSQKSGNSSSLIEINNAETNNKVKALIIDTGVDYWINIRSTISAREKTAITHEYGYQRTRVLYSYLSWNRTETKVQSGYVNFEQLMRSYEYVDTEDRCGYMSDDGKWHDAKCRARKSFICSRSLDCERGYYGSNCDEVCHCYQSQCDQYTGVCDYGCEHGWMGFRCDQVKVAADVATYCVNSPTKGKYALLRVDRKNVKYDKIYIINESQDTSSSTPCDQGMFNEDVDGVLNLKILIQDDNTTSPSCYHTKTDRGVFKWALRTEEVSGFFSYYDRLYELSCDFTAAETLSRNNKQAISGIYEPSKVNITQTTEDVQLFIQNPATTSRVSQVQIGSRIQLAMLLNKRDDITASGISPYKCSCSTPDGKTIRQLTDSNGCPVPDSPVFALTGSNDSYLTSNVFDAFAIKGSLGLIFTCSFEFCFESNETKCADRCGDFRSRSSLEIRSRTKRSTNENRKNGQASAYLLLIPKTQKDKQTDMNNLSVDSDGTVSKHVTVITGSILVLVLCGGLVAVVMLVRSSRTRTVMKQTNVKITE